MSELTCHFIKDFLNNLDTFNKLDNTIKRQFRNEIEDKFGIKIENTKSKCTPCKKEPNVCLVDKTKCICRVFNSGLGTQCNHDKKKGDYCASHFKKLSNKTLELGTIFEKRPKEFLGGKKKGKPAKWKNEEIIYKLNENTEHKTIDENEYNTPIMELNDKSDDKSNDIPDDKSNDIPDDKSNDTSNDIPDDISDGKLDDIPDDIGKTLENITLCNNGENIQDLELEIDDELVLDGVLYDQLQIEENVIYIIEKETGKKVAEWNGIDYSNIEWSSEIDKIAHISKINK